MRTSHRESHFWIWKKRIENHVGLFLDDLPDEPYRFLFDETDLRPKEVAYIIHLNNNMLY